MRFVETGPREHLERALFSGLQPPVWEESEAGEAVQLRMSLTLYFFWQSQRDMDSAWGFAVTDEG